MAPSSPSATPRTKWLIGTSLLLFALGWLLLFTADTRLIAPAGSLVIRSARLCGAALGGLLGLYLWRATRRGVRASSVLSFALIVPSFALLCAMLGWTIGARLTEAYLFRGGVAAVSRHMLPITGRGTDKSGPRARAGDGWFAISRLDYQLLAGPQDGSTIRGYCLPLIVESSGIALRARLPGRVPPSRTRRTQTIARCAPPFIIDARTDRR